MRSNFSSPSKSQPELCAIASVSNTPGMIGKPGKCPSKMVLTIEAKIEHEGSGFAVTSAKARVGKELKCSADLTFRHIPFPDPALRVHMDAMANKIGFPLQALPHD